MREFELMPNEEQIRDMALEYNKAKVRRDAVAASSICHSEPQPSASNISILFCLNTDIDNALRRLYSLAATNNRETINRVINIKKSIATKLVHCGEIKPSSAIGHTPYRAVSNSYAQLLRDITELHEQILVATYAICGTVGYQGIFDGESICGVLITSLATRHISV